MSGFHLSLPLHNILPNNQCSPLKKQKLCHVTVPCPSKPRLAPIELSKLDPLLLIHCAPVTCAVLGTELDSLPPQGFAVTVPFAFHQNPVAPFHVQVSAQVSPSP